MVEKETRLERRVGGIALVGLTLLIAGVLWGKGVTDNLDKKPLIISFEDATGINTNTPVYFHGVQVGSVSAISVDNLGATVKAHVKGDVDIRDDATATLRIMELTGGKKIELDPGTASTALGDRPIRGVNEGDIGEIFSMAASIASEIGPMMERADSLLAALNTLVTDPSIQLGVKSTITEFSQAGRSVNALLESSGPSISRTLGSLEQAAGELNRLLEKNRPAIEFNNRIFSNSCNVRRGSGERCESLFDKSRPAHW